MKKIFIPFLLIAFIACNNHQTEQRTDGFSDVPKTKEDSLYKDVMDGHDAAMGKMGKVKGYISQTQKALDSINKLPASANKLILQNQYKSLQDDLSYAENAMDMWMTAFNPDSNSADVAKRAAYLQGEKEKVSKVGAAIFLSVQKADSLFAVKH